MDSWTCMAAWTCMDTYLDMIVWILGNVSILGHVSILGLVLTLRHVSKLRHVSILGHVSIILLVSILGHVLIFGYVLVLVLHASRSINISSQQGCQIPSLHMSCSYSFILGGDFLFIFFFMRKEKIFVEGRKVIIYSLSCTLYVTPPPN